MIRFEFDKEKGVAAALYVVQRLIACHHAPDYHKIFKIFYFADQKHMARYGRPIFGDDYIAMKYGPVPSCLCDIFKAVKGENVCFPAGEFAKFFSVEGYMVKALCDPDLDELSESDLECLDQSIAEYGPKSFDDLMRLSHKLAWDNADLNSRMSHRDIAKEAGATPEMISYMSELAENRGAIKNGGKLWRLLPT